MSWVGYGWLVGWYVHSLSRKIKERTSLIDLLQVEIQGDVSRISGDIVFIRARIDKVWFGFSVSVSLLLGADGGIGQG